MNLFIGKGLLAILVAIGTLTILQERNILPNPFAKQGIAVRDYPLPPIPRADVPEHLGLAYNRNVDEFSCGPGETWMPRHRQCRKCVQRCKECVLGHPTKCLECAFRGRSLDSNCVKCGPGFFSRELDKDCQKCPPNCKVCSDMNTCEACIGDNRDATLQCRCYTGFTEVMGHTDCKEPQWLESPEGKEWALLKQARAFQYATQTDNFDIKINVEVTPRNVNVDAWPIKTEWSYDVNIEGADMQSFIGTSKGGKPADQEELSSYEKLKQTLHNIKESIVGGADVSEEQARSAQE